MQTRRKIHGTAVLVVLALLLTISDALHALVGRVLDEAGALADTHPLLGALLFMLLSAISAMLAFVSSAVVIPIAVYTWGRITTLILLWVAWLAGGCCTYAIGRTLGRRLAGWMVSPARRDYYAERISAEAGFLTVLLFQLALPSEVPGYVLGAARYHFGRYFLALAIAEIPFAVGAVYLGEGFIHRDYRLLIGLGISGLALTVLAFRTLHRRIEA